MNIALALILHPTDGTLLIAQRQAGVHQANLWEFPGGKCFDDEVPEACAARETREETGLEIVVLEAWPAITHAYPDRTVTLYPFLCRAVTGDAEPRGSRQVVWVRPDEIRRYPFPAANGPILDKLLGNPRGFTG